MIAVLDSSAALGVVFGREGSDHIREALIKADAVVVPRLYASEVSSACWKCYRFSDVPMAECERYLESCLALPGRYVDDEELAAEAFHLACLTECTVYDSMFMVLARRYNARLLTMDGKLIGAARKQSISVVGVMDE